MQYIDIISYDIMDMHESDGKEIAGAVYAVYSME